MFTADYASIKSCLAAVSVVFFEFNKHFSCIIHIFELPKNISNFQFVTPWISELFCASISKIKKYDLQRKYR